jgi:hypothetical protein
LKAIKLDEETLSIILKRIDQPEPLQAARLVIHLAENPKSPTVVVNTECSVGNISDVVHKEINPRAYDLGVMIGCEKPIMPIKNKFNQPSGQFLWSWYELPEAANDPIYNKK